MQRVRVGMLRGNVTISNTHLAGTHGHYLTCTRGVSAFALQSDLAPTERRR
jgi:hypothetical protein